MKNLYKSKLFHGKPLSDDDNLNKALVISQLYLLYLPFVLLAYISSKGGEITPTANLYLTIAAFLFGLHYTIQGYWAAKTGYLIHLHPSYYWKYYHKQRKPFGRAERIIGGVMFGFGIGVLVLLFLYM